MYTAVLENWIVDWGLVIESSQPKCKTLSNLGYNQVNEKLIDGCIAGERVAQKEIYEKLFGKMMSICRRYVRNNEDALEVINTGFFKVFNNIDKYKGKGSFEGWVSKIVINTALDHLRATKNYSQQLQLDEAFESKYNYAIDTDEYSNVDSERLYAMIDKLPAMSKIVFNMFAIDGYSHKEISKDLKMSKGTSKWHVSYARQKLKEMLIKEKNNLMIVNE